MAKLKKAQIKKQQYEKRKVERAAQAVAAPVEEKTVVQEEKKEEAGGFSIDNIEENVISREERRIKSYKEANPEEVARMKEAGFEVMAVYNNESDIPQDLKSTQDFLNYAVKTEETTEEKPQE